MFENKIFNSDDVELDLGMCCILVNFSILCIENEIYIYTQSFTNPHPPNSSNMYITDGKTRQIYTISNHY